MLLVWAIIPAFIQPTWESPKGQSSTLLVLPLKDPQDARHFEKIQTQPHLSHFMPQHFPKAKGPSVNDLRVGGKQDFQTPAPIPPS